MMYLKISIAIIVPGGFGKRGTEGKLNQLNLPEKIIYHF